MRTAFVIPIQDETNGTFVELIQIRGCSTYQHRWIDRKHGPKCPMALIAVSQHQEYKMKSSKADKHVVIAVDSFKSDGQKLSNGLSLAFAFCQQMRAIPFVKSVIGPAQFGWPTGAAKAVEDKILKIGESHLRTSLAGVAGHPSYKSEVVFQRESSKKAQVQTLLRSAKKSGAELIVTFSHVGKETIRHPLGGFVLSLIYQTHTPILVINSRAPAGTKVKRIAFATDFAKGSETAFNVMIRTALELGSELLLLHVLPILPEAELGASSGVAGGWSAVEAFLEKEEAAMRRKAAKWMEHANSEGVVIKFELVTNTLAIADSILKIADQSDCDIIAVTEKTGPIASLILGSITRSVLRNAVKPVLVFTLPRKN
jgi:nucleotide-binding universal stress UspA family protein